MKMTTPSAEKLERGDIVICRANFAFAKYYHSRWYSRNFSDGHKIITFIILRDDGNSLVYVTDKGQLNLIYSHIMYVIKR